MGEVVNLRDYDRKPKDDLRPLLHNPDNANRAFWIGPEQTEPFKDTAPSEFCAPSDGDCA